MSIWTLLEDDICYFCGASDPDSPGICSNCSIRLRNSMAKRGSLCPVCSQPVLTEVRENCHFCRILPRSVGRFISLSYFNGSMKEIITHYKSGKMLSFRFFLAEMIHITLEKKGLADAVVVPVPPRKWKIHLTGWDQVDLLCTTLKCCYGRSICRCLVRNDRLQQKTLNFHDRKIHMQNNLKLKQNVLDRTGGRPIVLLDDVCTTGATISAAADLVSDGGSIPVTALVLSSVI